MAVRVLSCWLNTGNHAFLCDDCRRSGRANGAVKVVATGSVPQKQPCAWCGKQGVNNE